VVHAPVPQREEREWIATLRTSGGRSAAAVDLHRYLRRGLQKALAGRALRPEDLDDFAHDALVRILEKLEDFRGESRFRTWAMAVAVRVALTALRRRRHPAGAWEGVEDDFLESVPAAPSPASDPSRRLERQGLLDALAVAIRERLTERQRAAVLGELRGVPTEVLAEHLGTTRNAFYKLHHDARKKLRAAVLAAGFTASDVREELDRVSEE
jgi:RNA polymerase sigma-70 factor (ECF subfamily)